MGAYFRFLVQLSGIHPPIFRRFLLTTKASFYDLHIAIQTACGWDNDHLFEFRKSRSQSIAGVPTRDGDGPPDAGEVPLATWFGHGGHRKCVYVYDFGDSWLHDIKLEGTEHHEGDWEQKLLDGARSFPPEDCGGSFGYERCVRFATTGEDPDDLAQWIGKWNPEHFDLISTKRRFDR